MGGARPRWDGGGVCLQTGHRRQLQKINILLLWKLVQSYIALAWMAIMAE